MQNLKKMVFFIFLNNLQQGAFNPLEAKTFYNQIFGSKNWSQQRLYSAELPLMG